MQNSFYVFIVTLSSFGRVKQLRDIRGYCCGECEDCYLLEYDNI
jgi:hypothetical protein